MTYESIKNCRACGSSDLQTIVEFGITPLADGLVKAENLDQPEIKVPLTLAFCPESGLVQILETVPPEILFCRDYPYFSSVSPMLMKHFGDSAQSLIDKRGLNEKSLVIEAASNDGYMLNTFVQAGVPVLGIDPAEGPANRAIERGINTLNTFFTEELANSLKAEGKQADVFLANNVLAHVPDLNGFVRGIKALLKPDGVAVIECPYVVDLVDHGEFDTIYHQHLCYFSVTALDRLFRSHGLFLNDVIRTTIHGGSLRLFVEPQENVQEGVTSLLKMEVERKVDRIDYYLDFADRVNKIKSELMTILTDLKQQGKSIVGYGAAAKATTLLAYFGIDTKILDYVADLNQFKQGRFMGGNHLPIVAPTKILEDQPDYMLILAWNFADEIIKQQSEFQSKGGKFIVPIPSPKVV